MAHLSPEAWGVHVGIGRLGPQEDPAVSPLRWFGNQVGDPGLQARPLREAGVQEHGFAGLLIRSMMMDALPAVGSDSAPDSATPACNRLIAC